MNWKIIGSLCVVLSLLLVVGCVKEGAVAGEAVKTTNKYNPQTNTPQMDDIVSNANLNNAYAASDIINYSLATEKVLPLIFVHGTASNERGTPRKIVQVSDGAVKAQIGYFGLQRDSLKHKFVINNREYLFNHNSFNHIWVSTNGITEVLLIINCDPVSAITGCYIYPFAVNQLTGITVK